MARQIERQAATNRVGETDLPVEGARLAPADPNTAAVAPTPTEEGLTSLAETLPPDGVMQLIALARDRGETLSERKEAYLLIWDAKQKQNETQLDTLLGG